MVVVRAKQRRAYDSPLRRLRSGRGPKPKKPPRRDCRTALSPLVRLALCLRMKAQARQSEVRQHAGGENDSIDATSRQDRETIKIQRRMGPKLLREDRARQISSKNL